MYAILCYIWQHYDSTALYNILITWAVKTYCCTLEIKIDGLAQQCISLLRHWCWRYCSLMLSYRNRGDGKFAVKQMDDLINFTCFIYPVFQHSGRIVVEEEATLSQEVVNILTEEVKKYQDRCTMTASNLTQVGKLISGLAHHHITGLVVNYGISNTIVLEIP